MSHRISPLLLGMALCLCAAPLPAQTAAAPAATAASSAQRIPDDPRWLNYPGGEGPGKGKRIILIAADQEYRSEQSMPMMAAILSQRHGFDCTVLFGLNDKDEVDPTMPVYPEKGQEFKGHHIAGLEYLSSADLVIFFPRLLTLPMAERELIVRYLDSGKPILSIRTGNHGFHAPLPYQIDGKRVDWGTDILGGTFLGHHGNWHADSTRGILVEDQKNHPILTGVTDIWGDSDVYRTYPEGGSLPAGCTALVWGQPLLGRKHDDAPNPEKEPLPVAWTKTWQTSTGRTARVFQSTMGSGTDLECADLRRLLINAVYWGLGMEAAITPDLSVDIVGDYQPRESGFNYAELGVTPQKPAAYRSTPSHASLPGLERSQLDPALKGLAMIGELNCVACHEAPALRATSRQSPRLSGIGSRADAAWIQAFIADPQHTKPGTLMPGMPGRLSAAEKAEAAESITHYLLSPEQENTFAREAPDAVAAARGEKLFHSTGCAACHSPRGPDGQELLRESSVPLGDLTPKYSHRSLTAFLQRPHQTRPSGRMPDLRLPRQEIEQISHYLLRRTTVPGHLAYTTWQGKVWEGLEGDVEPVRAGLVDDFSLESLSKDKIRHHTAIRYTGFLRITDPGDYTFFLELNGGSLRLNGQEVVSLAPSDQRGPKKLQGTAPLAEGANAIELTYFHTGREPRFVIEMEGPGRKRQPIPSAILSISDKPIPISVQPQPDPVLAAKGKAAFATLGCAQCHDDIPAPRLTFPEMRKLDPARGCLTGSPDTPRFALSAEQKTLIAAALPGAAGAVLTDEQTVSKTLATLNCIACHERAGLGGIAPERNAYFTGTSEALGDQGRLPPPLTHVGAKLTPEWLREVLNGGRQREYLTTRMPVFGEAQVAPLIERLPRIDKLEAVTFPEVADIRESKAAGYGMLGADGFSCIACHDFNGQKSGGAGALDLVNTTQRLTRTWFHLYMRQPSRFHPTVIMPSYWPGGQSIRKEVLGGDTGQQIEALWAYLSDGDRAKSPQGLSRQSPELRVTDETLICRGRGPVGYRGIGVGYPGRISLAFDSEEMALSMIWKGAFANVDNGSFNPRGEDRITFAPGIPFHPLTSLDDAWPYKGKTNYTFPQDHGYQFRGYQLDARKRPTLLYHYGEIAVQDFFEDITDGTGRVFFRRTLTFDAPAPQSAFYFRAATGQTITADADGWQIGSLHLRVSGHPAAEIRKGDPNDLLIPLQLPAGKTTLQLDYQW